MTSEAMKILIVEDEALLAMSYKMALHGGACEVVGIARNAEEALRLTKEKQPEVVLMDIKLQGQVDGIEVAREILRDLKISVIYMTGNTDEETKKRALGTHPMAYLEKPVDCEKLQQLLCTNKKPAL